MSEKGDATTSPIEGNILIMGDFFLQEVLLKVPPSPRHPEAGPTPYNHFSFQSGSVLFDFLTQLTLEHAWLQTHNARPADYVKKRIEIAKRINGPCLLQGWSPDKNTTRRLKKRPTHESIRNAVLSRARKEHITLEGTSASNNVNARKALRIKEVQGHSAQSKTPLQRDWVDDIDLTVMSCDFQFFLEEGLQNCFSTFSSPKNPCAVVCRIVLGATVSLDAPSTKKGSTKVEIISENLALAVKTLSRVGEKSRPTVAVLSSSTLKNFGHNISFRRSWERTISDTLRAIDQGTLRTLLANFDYVVISYFNEAALVVDRKANQASFIFHPTSLEADLSLSINGATKGTETLVTQAVACAFLMNKPLDLEGVANATLKGIKASRFLLLRGYSRAKLGEWDTVGDTLSIAATPEDPVLIALQSKTTIEDVRKYLWNRSRKNAFFKLQEQLAGTDIPPDKDLATWPFGDIIEILCKGYISYGSFPPTGVDDDVARNAIVNSTRDSAAAFDEAGWLQQLAINCSQLDALKDVSLTSKKENASGSDTNL